VLTHLSSISDHAAMKDRFAQLIEDPTRSYRNSAVKIGQLFQQAGGFRRVAGLSSSPPLLLSSPVIIVCSFQRLVSFPSLVVFLCQIIWRFSPFTDRDTCCRTTLSSPGTSAGTLTSSALSLP
jgi:hypothetical protein